MDTLLTGLGLLGLLGYGLYRLRRWGAYWHARFTDNHKEY